MIKPGSVIISLAMNLKTNHTKTQLSALYMEGLQQRRELVLRSGSAFHIERETVMETATAMVMD